MEKDLGILQFRTHTANRGFGFDNSGNPFLFGAFGGATGIANGSWGYVPTPVAGDHLKFLKGDGTWATIGAGGTVTEITLAPGTNGTDVNIENPTINSSGTITIHIPSASQANRGLVTTTDQVFQGSKQFRSALLISDSVALTLNTSFDVHALTGLSTTIARFSNLSNQNVLRVQVDSTIILGTTTSPFLAPAASNGSTLTSGTGLRHSAGADGHWFQREGGSITAIPAFSYVNTGGNIITTVTAGSFAKYTPSIASGVGITGANYTILQVTPSLSLSAGTTIITGIQYNPSVLGSTGLTHYGLTVASGPLNGFGTLTPSATLHIVGTFRFDLGSDATNDLYYRHSSGVIARLGLGANGTFLGSNGSALVWTTPAGGGGGTPAGTNTEIQINNGGAFAVARVFLPSNGNITFGDATLTGDTRVLSSTGSATEVSISFVPKGGSTKADVIIGKLTGTGSGNIGHVVIGSNQADTFERLISAGTNTSNGNTTLGIRTQGATSILNFYSNTFRFRQSIENDGSTLLGSINISVGASASDNITQISSTSFAKPFIITAGIGELTTSINGRELRLIGGAAFGASGNGNGGGVLIQSGAKRSAGSGGDGNINLNALTGGITLTTSLTTIGNSVNTRSFVFSNTTGSNNLNSVNSSLFISTNNSSLYGVQVDSTNFFKVISTTNIDLTHGSGDYTYLTTGANNTHFLRFKLAASASTNTIDSFGDANLIIRNQAAGRGISIVHNSAGAVGISNTVNARELTFNTVDGSYNVITSVGLALRLNAPAHGIYASANTGVILEHGSGVITFSNNVNSRQITFNTNGSGNIITSVGDSLNILSTSTGQLLNLNADSVAQLRSLSNQAGVLGQTGAYLQATTGDVNLWAQAGNAILLSTLDISFRAANGRTIFVGNEIGAAYNNVRITINSGAGRYLYLSGFPGSPGPPGTVYIDGSNYLRYSP